MERRLDAHVAAPLIQQLGVRDPDPRVGGTLWSTPRLHDTGRRRTTFHALAPADTGRDFLEQGEPAGDIELEFVRHAGRRVAIEALPDAELDRAFDPRRAISFAFVPFPKTAYVAVPVGPQPVLELFLVDDIERLAGFAADKRPRNGHLVRARGDPAQQLGHLGRGVHLHADGDTFGAHGGRLLDLAIRVPAVAFSRRRIRCQDGHDWNFHCTPSGCGGA